MSTRELRREFRDGRGLFNEVIGGVGDLIGAGHRIRGDVGRDRAYGYNSAYRGDVAQDRYRDYRDRRDDHRDDDRRAAPYSGRGGQGPRGFSGGQGRGDARGDQGQGQDPRILATEDYVYALADAAQSPAGSPERMAAMRKAKDILTNPENGLIQSDGSVRFPEGMRVPLNRNSYIHFEGIDSRATSPEVGIQKGVNAVAGQRIGTPLTDADIAALRGTAAPAGATIPVGDGPVQPKPDAPQAPGTGTAKPDAPGAATFALPEASGPAAKIYTKNSEGRTMNAEDAPKISASQVKAIQAKLGVKDDGMWGPNTQAAFADAAKKAGVKPSDVDFTNPNDPETVKVMAQFNAPAAGAGVTPPKAPGAGVVDPTKTAQDDNTITYKGADGKSHVAYGKDGKPLKGYDSSKDGAVGGIPSYERTDGGNQTSEEPGKAYVGTGTLRYSIAYDEKGKPLPENTEFGKGHKYTRFAVTVDEQQLPTATDAARLAEAVKVLAATAGADRELSAGNMAALQQTPELMKKAGQAFDLNQNGHVEEAELNRIVAAAAAKPEAERVTVVGGVAALNPLFAGASFAPVQPATDVATVDSPLATQTPRMPPPIYSELTGLDLNSVDGPNSGLPSLIDRSTRQL